MMNVWEIAGRLVRLWWPNTKDDGKEYSEEDIVSCAAPMLHKGYDYCGIYFLLSDDEIVYVGQSKSVRNRMDQHTYGDDIHEVKNFNRYFMVHCELEELNKLEAYYILKFRPRYNIAIPRGGE